MLKKSAFVSAAAAGVMMLGAPAWAGGGHGDETNKWVHKEHTTMVENENENSVVDVGDVASGNAVPVCHNKVNVLGVQVADIANGLGVNVPIANGKPASNAEGGANCTAVANTVEKDD